MSKQLISLIIPAFNEEAIVDTSLMHIHNYIKGLPNLYDWEIIVIDDGSTDQTYQLALKCTKEIEYLRVVRHNVNRNLGNALKTGFNHAKGSVIITYDMDLSYSPAHISRLLETISATASDIVVASPYMKKGKVKNVPFIRKMFSRCANYLMCFFSPKKISTYTSMVRAYNAEFIKNLNLKSSGYAVNPEIIFKAFILRAKIVEIPAELNWEFQNKFGKKRISSIKLASGVLSGLMSSFIFRPYMFFFLISIFLFIIFFYIAFWISIHIYDVYPEVTIHSQYFDDKFSNAVAEVFKNTPHSFLIGGFIFISAVQFLSMSFLSLQKKRYFDELFHINTSILKHEKTILSNLNKKK